MGEQRTFCMPTKYNTPQRSAVGIDLSYVGNPCALGVNRDGLVLLRVADTVNKSETDVAFRSGLLSA
jgi:hypothetical protein